MENKGGSLSFISLLTLVFIVLKLCKVINWSWLWVLSPLWISLLLSLLILVVIMIFSFFKMRGK